MPEILDSKVTMRTLLIQRFASKMASQIVPLLSAAADDIVSKINSLGPGAIQTKKRYTQLLSEVRKTLDGEYTAIIDSLTAELGELGESEAKFLASTITQSAASFEAVIPAASQITAAAAVAPMSLGVEGVTMAQLTKGWQTREVTRASRIVTLGFFNGQTTDQIARNVKAAINGVTTRDAKTIARTATNHVATQARLETMKDNSDVITGYRIVATLDFKTSSTCRDKDGDVVKLSAGRGELPPFHHGCRTTIAPEVDSRFNWIDSGATRASKDGYIKSSTTYYEWLSGQPAALQDEALGKTKGRIFRNSGLSADEFKTAATNRMGKELTIDEMSSKSDQIAAYLDK